MAAFTLPNPLTSDNLIQLLKVIINGLILLAIPITVIMIIWAGVLYMTSAGGSRIQTATKALTYAVIGFGLLLIASGIVSAILDFLGIRDPVTGITTRGPSTLQEVLKVLTDASGWLFSFAVTASVAMIIVSGLGYIFARGNAEQASRSLRILMYSIIGLVVAAMAWGLVDIVSNFLTQQDIFSILFTGAHAAAPVLPSRPAIAPSGAPDTIGKLLDLFSTFTGWLFAFAVMAAVAVIVVAGLMYVFSRGSERSTDMATKAILYAVIGVAIAGLAWGLVNVAGSVFFGETFFKNP